MSLTNKEQEVYRYLLQGLSYLDISDKLNVKRTTTVDYITNVYAKKLVNNRAELMAERIKELEQEVKELRRNIYGDIGENKLEDLTDTFNKIRKEVYK